MLTYLLLFFAGLWGGAQSALAGGGSFATFPALMLAGLDARAANITSTVALFPAQGAAAVENRKLIRGYSDDPFPILFAVSLVGGLAGAGLLLILSKGVFEKLVPWLVLVSTGLFALESFGGLGDRFKLRTGPWAGAAIQFAVAVYGGFFGGGNGIIMIAVLTAAGVRLRAADATKNVLAAAMNGAAILVFVFSSRVDWPKAAAVGAGSILGGFIGARLIPKIPKTPLRIAVIAIGLTVTVGLLLR